ncbi:hypothetical protein [Stutzerimonas azotifigens]|uniref:hypothetical protein n=1 Tax=Stutzerimonas azotifigens TaxID=291995 RepID=UPI0004211180|nr:hypothetical protein [Stutzerimonas azotifigens]
MNSMRCTHRDHTIIADVLEHPGSPMPWAAGCRIIEPSGQMTRRLPLPVHHAFMAELEQAQHASIAHGKWLVDQALDHGRELSSRAA